MAPAHDLELEQPLADQSLEGNITAMLRGRFEAGLRERRGNWRPQHVSRSATHSLWLPGQASEVAYGF